MRSTSLAESGRSAVRPVSMMLAVTGQADHCQEPTAGWGRAWRCEPFGRALRPARLRRLQNYDTMVL